MNVQSTVPCPDCGSPIPIDCQLLLSGTRFQCPSPSCGVAISLAQEDRGVVSKAVTEFEALQQHALNSAQQDRAI
ncbi:MAG: hypothetical protein P8104_06725 [Gammaproteobacteria bacterium]